MDHSDSRVATTFYISVLPQLSTHVKPAMEVVRPKQNVDELLQETVGVFAKQAILVME